MREILFRGKRTDNGEWVEGYLIYDEFCNTSIPYIGYLFGDDVDVVEVAPETVGQYTGLKDKNGKRIFEGDILDTPDRLVVVTWLDANAQFDCDFLRYAHDIEIINFKGIFPREFYKYEVIGNIHDNPELLEVNHDKR